MGVAEAQEREQSRDDRLLQRLLQFGRRVAVPVDVASFTGASQAFDVIRAGEQPDVVDLRDARHEALDGPRNEIFIVPPAQRIVERAVDLVRVDVARGVATGQAALTAAARVNRLDQRRDAVGRQQAGPLAGRVVADVGNADAIVRIEDGHRVVRPELQPATQRRGVAGIEQVQKERRQREVVDPVDLARDVDLRLIVAVHFDEHVHPARVRLGRDVVDERAASRES